MYKPIGPFIFGRMVGASAALARSVGAVIAADNTIVHYSTDNGVHMNTWLDASMTPFLGEKNTDWEGGWRVPSIVRWPSEIEAGSVRTEIMHHMDWLPTFLAAAGRSFSLSKKHTRPFAHGSNLGQSCVFL
ncbi:sulfatase-like hydrolase/transferase [Falsihalocynthiibacter sp. BN13B15]|uniref:sulfatase-like hydrolase/transferase n=1 Tax=Falsihalocynthiibacter sp. BN13B15 TaxID=3240871 RepID=UPI0035108FA7